MPLSPSESSAGRFDCLQEHACSHHASTAGFRSFSFAPPSAVLSVVWLPLVTVAGEIADWTFYERKQEKPLGATAMSDVAASGAFR